MATRQGADLEAQNVVDFEGVSTRGLPEATPISMQSVNRTDLPMAEAVGIDRMERSIRHGFARKVFALLTVQIIILMAVICLFLYIPEIQVYASSPKSTWLVILSGFLFLLMTVALSCIPDLNKKYPQNLFGLFLLTVVAGVFLGTLCAGIPAIYVWVAFAATTGLMLTLGLFACQTRFDFTGMGPYLSVAIMVLLIFSLFGGLSFTIRSDFNNGVRGIVWSAIGVFIFSMYVVYDIQLVVGGKHRLQFGVDDYIIATIALFTDFILIFALLLGAIGGSQN